MNVTGPRLVVVEEIQHYGVRDPLVGFNSSLADKVL